MSRQTRLLVVLTLNVALVAALVAVGISSHSLGVFAEGGDYLLDAAAIGTAVVALRLGRSRHPRAPDIAALVNGGWLLVLEVIVAVAAVVRLTVGAPAVRGLPVLIVSGVAAVVMGGGALVLGGEVDFDHDDDGNDLSMAAVLLDTIADAGAAAGVAVTGGVIYVTHGWYWLDPAVALLIAVVVGYHAARLLWKVVPRLG